MPENPPLPAGPAAELRFTLSDVVIEGATVYSADQLRPLYAGSLGKTVPLSEAQAIADRITTRYRSDGYLLSQAVLPRQDLRSGILHIRVVEGFVDRVVIEGDSEGDARGLLERYGAHITDERPLTVGTLERYLLLMNSLPGTTAGSALKPAAGTFGAADLVVTVTHTPVEASLSADNRLTRYLGSVEDMATLGLNGLAGLDERTQLQASAANPPRAMRLFGLDHVEQLDSDGTHLEISASQTRTHPGIALASLDMEAAADDIQLTLQHPFILLRSQTLAGRLAFDYRNTDTTVLEGATLTDDHVRALRLGGNYTFADSWDGTDLIDLQASRGVGLFDASVPLRLRSQPAAPVDYSKLNLDASRVQTLPAGFSLFAAVSAQASADPLLAAEQFSLGGAAFGSAYDPGTLAGDEGAAFRSELRYNGDIPGRLPVTYQGYGFYDMGAVWDKSGAGNRQSLASAGLGLRFGLTPHLAGTTELAVPLTRKADLVSTDHSPRLFFSLSAAF
jgi:hemolysin activation/secretion protein